MYGIYASITLQSSKSKKYATEIQLLRMQISNAKQQRDSFQQHLSEIRDYYKEYTNDIKL